MDTHTLHHTPPSQINIHRNIIGIISMTFLLIIRIIHLEEHSIQITTI